MGKRVKFRVIEQNAAFRLYASSRYTCSRAGSIGALLIMSLILTPPLTLLSHNAYAADDDYLKQLEVEAQKSAKPNPNKEKKSEADKSQMKQFEHLLQFERPATYEFYRKLTLSNREKVVSTYYKQENLSITSKKIFDLYFDQNK